MGCGTLGRVRAAQRNPVLIAQLSDTHVVARGSDAELHVDNNAQVAEAIDSLCAETPAISAVVVSGDVTNDGRSDEFAMFADLCAPIEMPLLPIPGNHDDRSLLRSTFPDVGWEEADHASWVAEVAGVRVIGLDSTRAGEDGAEFDDERAAWLSEVLAAAFDGPTLLAMHHPPFITGIGWMDDAGFLGLDLFRSAIAGSAVDRIMCGHLHRPMTSTVGGVVAQVGISPVQHIALDLDPDSGIALVRDPIGYQIHRIVDREIVTHTRYTGTDEQAFTPAHDLAD